jgi:hypothetical protein
MKKLTEGEPKKSPVPLLNIPRETGPFNNFCQERRPLFLAHRAIFAVQAFHEGVHKYKNDHQTNNLYKQFSTHNTLLGLSESVDIVPRAPSSGKGFSQTKRARCLNACPYKQFP